MNTLDFGEVMEKDCWFEDYDLVCPYCAGEGERTVYIRGDVRSFEEPTVYTEKETEYCEECADGQFEIMWNTAYEVYVPYRTPWEQAHLLAWDQGFCLIKHNDTPYLLMGMCGLDCTWKIHWTRFQIQEYLSLDDIRACIGSGGHVFVSDDMRKVMCKYFKENIPTPEAYAKSYAHELEKIDGILAYNESKVS